MAEFCLECWNKINKKNDGAYKYIMSSELELCEACGEEKRVIVRERYWFLFRSWLGL